MPVLVELLNIERVALRHSTEESLRPVFFLSIKFALVLLQSVVFCVTITVSELDCLSSLGSDCFTIFLSYFLSVFGHHVCVLSIEPRRYNRPLWTVVLENHGIQVPDDSIARVSYRNSPEPLVTLKCVSLEAVTVTSSAKTKPSRRYFPGR